MCSKRGGKWAQKSTTWKIFRAHSHSNFAQHSFGFFSVWKTNFPGKFTTNGERFKVEWTLVRGKGSGWEETGSETKSCDVASLLAYRMKTRWKSSDGRSFREKNPLRNKVSSRNIFCHKQRRPVQFTLVSEGLFNTFTSKAFLFCFGFYWLTFLSLHVMISVVTKRLLLQLEEISLLKSDEHNKIVNA